MRINPLHATLIILTLVGNIAVTNGISAASAAPTQPKSDHTVTKDEFDRNVIKASHKQTVIVEFYAEWCASCRELRPVLDSLAQKNEGLVKFVRMDADTNEALVNRFGVMALPALLVFSDGVLILRVTGRRSRSELNAIFVGNDQR